MRVRISSVLVLVFCMKAVSVRGLRPPQRLTDMITNSESKILILCNRYIPVYNNNNNNNNNSSSSSSSSSNNNKVYYTILGLLQPAVLLLLLLLVVVVLVLLVYRPTSTFDVYLTDQYSGVILS